MSERGSKGPQPLPEKPEQFESSINRHTLRYYKEIGGKFLEFTLTNSKLFHYPDEYKEFDHVFRANDDFRDGVYYFRQDFGELYHELDAMQFTNTRQPFPTLNEERVYYTFQQNKLERELDKFSKGGDL